MQTGTAGFRDDINGLRAWAVVAVILYHFRIPGVPGGFAGVDVFFVISGFLMTRIVLGGLEAGRFSILGFYMARARRIVPALAVLCAVLMALGWFGLSHFDYRMLASHSLAALGFYSNFTFWQEAGYFDPVAYEKLLLHTWSLSVEWQFYLLFPLVLAGLWRFAPGRRAATLAIAAGLALSLCASILVTPARPEAAFYLLPTRAWEMLAGGLVWLLVPPGRVSGRAGTALAAAGFALILGSVLLLAPGGDWPGAWAVLPVLGTVLVLAAARRGSLWSGSRAAQWLGDCSYSLYLWHWPLVVGLAYLGLLDRAGTVLAALVATLVLGWLSYRLVELPGREGLARLGTARGAGALVAGLLLVVVPGIAVRAQQGVPQRLPAHVAAVFEEAGNRNPRAAECYPAGGATVPECTYGGPALGAIVIGDSHAAALVRAVEKALPDEGLHVLDWTLSSCPTIFGVRLTNATAERCAAFLDHAFEKQRGLDPAAPLVVINRLSTYLVGPNEFGREEEVAVPILHMGTPHAFRSPEFLAEMREGLIATACAFAAFRPVYLVRPIPELVLDVPRTMGRALILGRERQVSVSLETYRARHAFAWETQDLAAARCGARILDPLPILCAQGVCAGDRDGLPIYFDDDHLNERGGALLAPMFETMFGETDRPL